MCLAASKIISTIISLLTFLFALDRANPARDIWARPSWTCSFRFDDDVKQLLCTTGEPTKGFLTRKSHSTNEPSLKGLWQGGWYVSPFCQFQLLCFLKALQVASQSGLSTVFVTFRGMDCQLREYICTDPVKSVVFLDGDRFNEDNIVRAWFNAGIEIIEETVWRLTCVNLPLSCLLV